jgi:putative SOS response-associated peptidase YedK
VSEKDGGESTKNSRFWLTWPDPHSLWQLPSLTNWKGSIKELEIILQDGITHDIKYYPVSTLVNSVKNNNPNCIKPIDENL